MVLNIKNFKRLRRYIAEKVPPRLIYMDWWLSQNGKDIGIDFQHSAPLVPSAVCNTAGCIYGHCAVRFSKRKTLSEQNIVDFAVEFLGVPKYSAILTAVSSWPTAKLRDAYDNGTARQKKAAVLARLDRVIERGDLD